MEIQEDWQHLAEYYVTGQLGILETYELLSSLLSSQW